MKPIEPGCLAMIVGSEVAENNGKVVTVIECVGMRSPLLSNPAVGYTYYIESTSPSNPLWLVDKDIKWVSGNGDPFAPESLLMRIDGGEEQFQEEWQGHFEPEEVEA